MSAPPKLRLGIAGCGDHSHVHAAAAQELTDIDIVCACDIDAARAQAWASKHHAESGYASLDPMLGHHDLGGDSCLITGSV